MSIDELVKVGKYYLGPIKDWESKLYGFIMRSGVGDFIINQMQWLIKLEDYSEEAISILEDCISLLKERKRWPDGYQENIPEDRQCKTRLCSMLNKHKKRWNKFWNKQRVKLNWETNQITAKYRSQGDMTRDPYIGAISYAVRVGRYDLIDGLTIPNYLWRGPTWKWFKYLKDPSDENWDSWVASEKLAAKFRIKDFVSELITLREEAANIRRNT